jgi:hypothetical protein
MTSKGIVHLVHTENRHGLTPRCTFVSSGVSLPG